MMFKWNAVGLIQPVGRGGGCSMEDGNWDGIGT